MNAINSFQARVPRNVGPWTGEGVPLWRCVQDLAEAWRTLPFVEAFSAMLPRNVSRPSTGIPEYLQKIHVGNGSTGHISAHPLRLKAILQLFRQFPYLGPEPAGWAQWARSAEIIEVAHRFMTVWLRSRMPGYPNLPAPQLAAGTHLTTLEYTDRIPWTRQERAMGYQFASAPPAEICQLLRANSVQAGTVVGAMGALATELSSSVQWNALAEAKRALTPAARTELSEARKAIAAKLSSTEVSAHSTRAMDAFNYRVTVLEDHLACLPSASSAYADAFNCANNFLDLVADEVFGQLVAYGRPARERNPQSVDYRPGSTQLVSFTRIDVDSGFSDRLEIGQLIHLDGLFEDVVITLLGATESFSHRGYLQRWSGLLLPGAKEAWLA